MEIAKTILPKINNEISKLANSKDLNSIDSKTTSTIATSLAVSGAVCKDIFRSR